MPVNSAGVRYAGERLLLRLVFLALFILFLTLVVPWIWSLASPFVIALAVAAMLQPLVRFGKEKLHLKRGLMTAVCVLVVTAVAFALLYWFVSFAVVQLINAANNAQGIVGGVVGLLQTAADKVLDMASSLPESVGATIRSSLSNAFDTLSNAAVNLARNSVNFTVSFAAGIPYALVYANFLILALIFVTNRYEGFMGFFSKAADNGGEEKNIRMLRQSAVKGMMGYIRVQLLFFVLTFLVSWVFFQAVGFQYAFLIGLAAAILELIPQFGCGTLYIPWSVICFIVGANRNGWLVLGLYCGYSLLRRVTEPTLLGTNLGVSPLASLFGMFVGMRMGGIPGLILGPIAMVILVSATRSHLFAATVADMKTVAAYMRARWQRGRETEDITNAEK